MRFTGLLDRTLSNRGTERTFGAKGHVAGPTNGPSRASEQSSSRANRKFKSGRPGSKCPKAPEKNLIKTSRSHPKKVLISLGGGGFCKFNPGRPSLQFGFGCRGLLSHKLSKDKFGPGFLRQRQCTKVKATARPCARTCYVRTS